MTLPLNLRALVLSLAILVVFLTAWHVGTQSGGAGPALRHGPRGDLVA